MKASWAILWLAEHRYNINTVIYSHSADEFRQFLDLLIFNIPIMTTQMASWLSSLGTSKKIKSKNQFDHVIIYFITCLSDIHTVLFLNARVVFFKLAISKRCEIVWRSKDAHKREGKRENTGCSGKIGLYGDYL